MSQETRYFDVSELDSLLQYLQTQGYTTLGPTMRDGVIVYAEIQDSHDLPRGWRDEQRPGHYRLHQLENDPLLFACAVGPQAWKRQFHPPELPLWEARQEGEHLRIEGLQETPPKQALIGVRGCELAAIARQDVILREGPYLDPVYSQRREQSFIVAVDCFFPAETCFCSSQQTGPEVHGNYDLALSEIIWAGSHGFLARVGSPAGLSALQALHHRPATEIEIQQQAVGLQDAAARMSRRLDPEATRQALPQAHRSEHWDEIADRCLACTNCTMVCPTCFCTSVHDHNDLEGAAQRTREWDSCFSADFSYLHGAGPVRQSVASRYRQWLTHKLSYWYEQFDSSGCVGCGRCISWCPVGIDITQEAAAFVAEMTEGVKHE